MHRSLISAFFLLILCAPRAFSAEPAYSGRSFFSLDRKIEQASVDFSGCSPSQSTADKLFCLVFAATLASGYYFKGDYSNADRFVRELDRYFKAVAPRIVCPSYQQRFDNSEVGFHKEINFAYYPMAFEIFSKSNPKAAQEIGMRAFICEALETNGYRSGWGNLGSRHLDQKYFLEYAGQLYGPQGADQVATFLAEIIGPMVGPLAELSRGMDNNSAAQMVTYNAGRAELFRNAVTYAQTLGLGGEFVRVLQAQADYAAYEVDQWSKRAQ